LKAIKHKFIISEIVVFLGILVSFPAFSYLYSKTTGEIIRNFVISFFFALAVMYFYHYNSYFDKFDYDNKEHPLRLMTIVLISLALSNCFPLISKSAWCFLVIGISVSMLSSASFSVLFTSGLIMYSCLLSPGGDIITFCIYFLSTIIGIYLFTDIDQSFKVGSLIIASVLILFSLETAGFVLLDNVALSAEQFIIPLVNVAINSVLLFYFLKYFNKVIANKYRKIYQEINDQEYKALIALKDVSREEYFRSIHTAYLAERMALAIGCDADACKNCAYYHRIKKAFDFTAAQCEDFVRDNDFPPKARTLLLDFLDKEKKIIAKEAGIVYISDIFISTLMNIFSKDKEIKIDYANIVNALFAKDYFIKALEESDLSQKDFKTIKEILLKETLYYDFLR